MAEFWQGIEFWGVVVSVIAGGVGLTLAKISNDTQRKSIRLETMFKVFELLKDQEQIEARRQIFHEYKDANLRGTKPEERKPVTFSEDTKKQIARLRTSYAQINMFIDKGLLDPAPFMQLYADSVIRIWKALEDDTKQKVSNGNQSAIEFNSLKEKAVRYYTDVLREDIPEIY